jgi:hypothetical protein
LGRGRRAAGEPQPESEEPSHLRCNLLRPIVALHGDRDGNVQIRKTDRLTLADRAAGGRAEIAWLPGVEHFRDDRPADAGVGRLLR